MPALDAIVARWLALMWPTVWQATAIGLLGLALAGVLRRAVPGAALVLALVALAKFVVPPVFTWPLAMVDRAAGLALPSGRWPVPFVILFALMVVHLGGVLAAGVRLWRRQVAIVGWRRAGGEADAGGIQDAYLAAARGLGVRRVPRLLLVEGLEGPLAVGSISPAVLVPTDLPARVAPPTLSIVLAHELAHHRHRDLIVEWLVSLVAALWWFNPVAWALASLVRELREERADAAVISAGLTTPAAYCRALLDVASAEGASPGAAMRERGHPLGRRFRRILGRRRRSRGIIALSAIFTAAFTLVSLPNTRLSRDRDRYLPAESHAGPAYGEVRRVIVRERRTIVRPSTDNAR